MSDEQQGLAKYRGYALGNLYPVPRNILKHILLSIFSRKFLQTARFELRFLHLAVRRMFGKKFYETGCKDYLNIAPGPQSHPGFFNIDAFHYPGLDCLYDCRKRLPFRDEAFQGIFAEHFVEHLDYIDELGCFLGECHRILVEGGTLRIITPDAERYFRCYLSSGLEEMERVRNIRPGFYNTRMEAINELFHQGIEHKFIFDAETLVLRCRQAGFRHVGICDYRKGCNPDLLKDREFRRAESLYVEATK